MRIKRIEWDVLELLLHKPHIEAMKNFAAELCLENQVPKEYDNTLKLSEKDFLFIYANATSLHLSPNATT